MSGNSPFSSLDTSLLRSTQAPAREPKPEAEQIPQNASKPAERTITQSSPGRHTPGSSRSTGPSGSKGSTGSIASSRSTGPVASTDPAGPKGLVRLPSYRKIHRRYSVDIYEDQITTLHQLAGEEMQQGGKGSKSAMVREALDQYIAKKHHPR
jgi:hypothetical protein